MSIFFLQNLDILITLYLLLFAVNWSIFIPGKADAATVSTYVCSSLIVGGLLFILFFEIGLLRHPEAVVTPVFGSLMGAGLMMSGFSNRR
jgi:uncharacterized membrane protein